jgi:Ca2+-binding RTX toxin-like protein
VLRRSIPLVAVLVLGVAAPAAWADPTATFAGGTLTVRLPEARDEAVLVRAGDAIRLNDAPIAGGPDVDDTNTINVIVETGGGARVVLDQRGGPFIDAGDVEIPVDVNGGTGFDELVIEGQSTNETIRIGGLGIDLIGNSNLDVTPFPAIDFVTVAGHGGSDTITATGGGTTGSAIDEQVQFVGGAGDDTLTGSTNRDVLFGEGGEDELSGRNSDDFISGGEADDVLDGGIRFDDLYGGPGDDELHGGEGDDVLDNSAGDDLLDGGPEAQIGDGDQVRHGIMTPTAGVTLDLGVAGPQVTGGAGVDTLVDVEGLGGTGFDDVLRGDGDDNVLDGDPGNDTVHGGAGQDAVTGGSGNDVLVLGPNQDTASAGAGADFVDSVDGGFDTVDCGLDVDAFSTDAGDLLTGCEGPAGGGGGPVTPPPPPPPPPAPPGPRTGELRATVTAPRSIKARKGAISFKVGCPATATGSCRITATVRAKVGKRTRKLGASGLVLAPGAQRTVKVKLTSAARRLLRRKRKLKATIRLTVRDDVGAGRTANRKVTLKR